MCSTASRFQIEKAEGDPPPVKGAMVLPDDGVINSHLVLADMLGSSSRSSRRSSVLAASYAATQYVVTVSDLLKPKPWVGEHPLGIFAFKRWKMTETGRSETGDKFQLKLPEKIGDVVLKVARRGFSRTLSTLVARRRRHHQGARDQPARRPANWVIATRPPLAGVRTASTRRADRAAARRESGLPADGRADGEDSVRKGRAREDALEAPPHRTFYGQMVDDPVQSLTRLSSDHDVGVGVWWDRDHSRYLPMFKMLRVQVSARGT